MHSVNQSFIYRQFFISFLLTSSYSSHNKSPGKIMSLLRSNTNNKLILKYEQQMFLDILGLKSCAIFKNSKMIFLTRELPMCMQYEHLAQLGINNSLSLLTLLQKALKIDLNMNLQV